MKKVRINTLKKSMTKGDISVKTRQFILFMSFVGAFALQYAVSCF